VGLLISQGFPGDAWLDSLVQRLGAQGLAVGVLLWDAGGQLADERKDTGRFRQAGAVATALVAPGFLQVTVAAASSLTIEEALDHLGPDLDLVLVAGTRPFPFPYLLVGEPGRAASCGDDPNLLAVVSEAGETDPAPVFPPEDLEGLANLLRSRLNK
jgi:molybdopterin-guanine dinucleotide biosynthesis protein MobB